MPAMTRARPLRFSGMCALGVLLCMPLSGCGNGAIPSIAEVRQYAVEFTTETGKVITAKSATLAEALRRLWRQVFPEWVGDVQVDPDDPLRGRLMRVYERRITVIEPDCREYEASFVLTNPPVRRSSAESEEWEVDLTDGELPELLRRDNAESQAHGAPDNRNTP